MNCPKCERAELLVLHTDSIGCTDCGSTMNISYCLCPDCQWACRMSNGKFLDELEITTDALEEVVGDLEEMLSECSDSEIIGSPDTNTGSMLGLIHPCVRCGETLTVYDHDTSEYECLICGFKWEILEYE